MTTLWQAGYTIIGAVEDDDTFVVPEGGIEDFHEAKRRLENELIKFYSDSNFVWNDVAEENRRLILTACFTLGHATPEEPWNFETEPGIMRWWLEPVPA